MNEIKISETVSYIPSSENPLSADIGMIRVGNDTWLYDVGNREKNIENLHGTYPIVLSHFHLDHTGNLSKLQAKTVYMTKETYRHLPKGTKIQGDIQIVTEPIKIGNLRIFQLPSSHAKGCLGLEVDETYAFVGDALYCRNKNGSCTYNAQFLKEEIETLQHLHAPYLLVSHFDGMIRKKDDVIAELQAIYAKREKDKAEIPIS